MVVKEKLRTTTDFYKKIMSFSYHIKLKLSTEASCSNNIQTEEKDFSSYYFQRFVSCFFLDRVKNV